jgi:glycerol kinase
LKKKKTMQAFNITNRKKDLLQAANTSFDLIVIGGGITGCGIALDATARGLKVLLVEKTDFAAGTSSKSTKLIHGGLRYLKQLEFGLVRETGTERAVVHNLAPHLVHPEKMLLPIVENGTFSKLTASLAISVYDFLANVKKEDRKKVFSKTETLEQEPLLNPDFLKGGIQYSEYRTDDARLTIELVKKAISMGAKAFNYCEVAHLVYEKSKLIGIECNDLIGETNVNFYAQQIVSAAGPWVDLLRVKDNSRKGKSLRLTKGVHIVVSKKALPVRHAVYFDAFDGRMLFAVPRGKVTYIGTSDTDYEASLDHVICTPKDVDYIIRASNKIFPKSQITKNDIVSSWAGLRPLIHEDGKSPSELSRKDEIFISESGLISIAGGKLTGYRKMAERIVDLVQEKSGIKNPKKSDTIAIKLTDNPFENYQEVLDYITVLGKEIGDYEAWYLTTIYGKQSELILHKTKEYLTENIAFSEALVMAEIWFTIEYEAVTNPIDFFNRRTGNIYFDIEMINQHQKIALATFTKKFGWSFETTNFWANEINKMVADAAVFSKKIEAI